MGTDPYEIGKRFPGVLAGTDGVDSRLPHLAEKRCQLLVDLEGLPVVLEFDCPVVVGQVNLGSAGLRLAIPESEDAAPGSQSKEAEEDEGTDGPSGGTPVETTVEKFLTFPLVGSLLESDEKSEALASLFLALYQALDEEKVTYAAGTLQFVLDASAAEKIAEQARNLGLNVTIRDQ